MSQRPEEVSLPSTHTSEAFVDFAYDMLQYTITKSNIHWIEPSCHKRTTEKVFEESFGDAVIEYHSFYVDSFADVLREHVYFMTYAEKFCEKVFINDRPLTGFFKYCALLHDIGSLELEYGPPDDIYPIVDKTAEVFDKYLKPHFTKAGGWVALYREVNEFMKHPNFYPSEPLSETSDDSASATADDAASATADTGESASHTHTDTS